MSKETRAKAIKRSEGRGVSRESTPLKQALKTKEVVCELLLAIHNLDVATANTQDKERFADFRQRELIELGDCLVTLTNCAHMLNSTTDECLDMAYEKISRRSGAMKDGFFVKEGDAR